MFALQTNRTDRTGLGKRNDAQRSKACRRTLMRPTEDSAISCKVRDIIRQWLRILTHSDRPTTNCLCSVINMIPCPRLQAHYTLPAEQIGIERSYTSLTNTHLRFHFTPTDSTKSYRIPDSASARSGTDAVLSSCRLIRFSANKSSGRSTSNPTPHPTAASYPHSLTNVLIS
jgi:hypothetical protein